MECGTTAELLRQGRPPTTTGQARTALTREAAETNKKKKNIVEGK